MVEVSDGRNLTKGHIGPALIPFRADLDWDLDLLVSLFGLAIFFFRTLRFKKFRSVERNLVSGLLLAQVG